MAMFLDYCALLNALDSGAAAKITIHNRRIDKEDFERSVLLPLRGDALDHYREEFNEMLRAQVTGTSNSMVRERYLTVSIVKRNIDEARTYFARVGTDLVTHLAKLSSVAAELSTPDRLRLLRDFFKAGPTTRPLTSTCAGTPNSATASRIGSAPTAWSSLPTTSKSMAASGGYSICRTMPATSRTASSRSCVTSTAA